MIKGKRGQVLSDTRQHNISIRDTFDFDGVLEECIKLLEYELMGDTFLSSFGGFCL